MKRPGAAILCLLVAAAAADEPNVRSGHPRIYLTADDLPGLKARCAGPRRELFQRMRRLEWLLKVRPSAGWGDTTNLTCIAFLHLLTGQQRYLDKTVEILEAFAARPPRDQYLAAEYLRDASAALDWTWPHLEPERRERFALALVETAEWMLKRVWRHSDYCNHFVNEHLAVLFPGVLLAGEDVAAQRVERLRKIGAAYLLDQALPAANEAAGAAVVAAEDRPGSAWTAGPPPGVQADACFVGGQFEGFSYNDWGYARPLALTCEMWRVATGQDLFRGSSFFRGQGIWHAYGLRPDTGSFARSEDCPSGLKPGENLKSFLHLLAARLNDPLAAWLARGIKWRYAQNGWKEILWRDERVAAKSPRALQLPAAACFPQLGHVYFRTGWSSPHAAFALFQCGPFYAGHQHLDNNSFVIHRAGSLAIDAGTNDYTTHRANYYARTVAHNAVLVFDPRERFGRGVWHGRGTGGSNDGGQLRPPGLSRAGEFRPGGPADTGRIVSFATLRHAAGCAGDATAAYSPAKVRRAIRAFYHLRPSAPGPNATDTFVVYDSVETLRELPATWVIHSIDRPKIVGRQFLITHGRGQLAGEVIRPQGAELKLIGGTGRESLVNGVNYPPIQRRPDAEAGAWRIEMPLASEALVLLHAGPRTGRLPAGAEVSLGAGRLVVKLDRPGASHRIVLDRRSGPLPQVEVLREGQTVQTLSLRLP